MLLFIISEIMVFGAFFTAYFFIRFVAEGHQLVPVRRLRAARSAIAGINTAILLSSSLTMHWAQTSIKNGNHFGLKAGMLLTVAARRDVPLRSRSTSTSTSASRRRTTPRARSSTGSPACTARTSSSASRCSSWSTVRAFRGHFSPEHHHGVEVPGIYWHFVDVMWVVVYTTIYIL